MTMAKKNRRRQARAKNGNNNPGSSSSTSEVRGCATSGIILRERGMGHANETATVIAATGCTTDTDMGSKNEQGAALLQPGS